METSPSDPAVKSVLRTRALSVLAVYAVSLAAPLPTPGAMAFYMGFKSAMIPITGWEPANHSRGDEIVAVTVGLAWLANPLILGGMIALARGSKGWALMLGTSAILFTLLASWLAVMTVMFLGSYALWISSMGLLVYHASQPVTLPEVQSVGPRSMPQQLSPPTMPTRTSDGLARECRKWAMAAVLADLPVLLISVWVGFLGYPLVPVYLYAAHLLLWGAMILLARGSSRHASVAAAVAAVICMMSARSLFLMPSSLISGIGLLGVAALIIWGTQRIDMLARSDSGGGAQVTKLDVERLLKRYDELG